MKTCPFRSIGITQYRPTIENRCMGTFCAWWDHAEECCVLISIARLVAEKNNKESDAPQV